MRYPSRKIHWKIEYNYLVLGENFTLISSIITKDQKQKLVRNLDCVLRTRVSIWNQTGLLDRTNNEFRGNIWENI